jgi:glycosyltransferase involved in cell wall biosynthesis
MVRYIYQYSDRIFATSPSFVEMIRKRMDEGHERVSYWPQYAEEFYQPVGRETVEEIPDDDRFKVVFTGNIGQAQGLDILPKVANVLKERGKTDIGFVIVGDGRRREQLLSDVEENGVESMFVMVDRQPAKRIPQLLAACDVAFVSFVEDPLFTATIPAKLQSYMACRMPIVAVAAGETERVVREAACGMTCGFGDVEGLADILVALQSNADLKQMGENAEQYCKKHFSKKILMDQMDSVLEGKEFASV